MVHQQHLLRTRLAWAPTAASNDAFSWEKFMEPGVEGSPCAAATPDIKQSRICGAASCVYHFVSEQDSNLAATARDIQVMMALEIGRRYCATPSIMTPMCQHWLALSGESRP